jgi:hypothetical protein
MDGLKSGPPKVARKHTQAIEIIRSRKLVGDYPLDTGKRLSFALGVDLDYRSSSVLKIILGEGWMADTTEVAPQPIISPPTQGVGQFVISNTAAEFLLTFGNTRVVFNNNAQPTGTVVPEWLMTLSFSPVMAKQLSDALQLAIKNYELSAKFTIVVPEGYSVIQETTNKG